MTLGVAEKSEMPEKSFLMDSVLAVGMIVIFVMGFYIPGPLQHLLQEASRVAGEAVL